MSECSFCQKEVSVGLQVFSLVLCAQCEQSLINTQPDEPQYLEFIEKLKTKLPSFWVEVG